MKRYAVLSIDAKKEHLPVIAEFLETLLLSGGISERDLFEVGLAVDEACSNVILHGYGCRGGTIEIGCQVTDEDVVITISDFGIPFNPLEAPPPDLAAGVEERAVGGLGVHLIKSVMDSVSYEHREGKNILSMVKVRHSCGCG